MTETEITTMVKMMINLLLRESLNRFFFCSVTNSHIILRSSHLCYCIDYLRSVRQMNRQEKFIISLSVALLLVAFMAYKIIPEVMSSLRPKGGNFIGMVLESQGEIKMRFGESVNWKPARKKDRIYSKVYLFTGENSSASFAFLDESSLNLGPNSLIYIDLSLDQNGK